MLAGVLLRHDPKSATMEYYSHQPLNEAQSTQINQSMVLSRLSESRMSYGRGAGLEAGKGPGPLGGCEKGQAGPSHQLGVMSGG